MGTIVHHAIIVTTCDTEILEAMKVALQFGCVVIGPGYSSSNEYRSILICPDGSKVGWETHLKGNIARDKFRQWLIEHPDYEWVEVGYGYEAEKSVVTNDFNGVGEEVKISN